jgi:hypothetical protein
MQAQHLNNLKVGNLKKLATAAKIPGRSKMKKAELINALIWMFPSGVPVPALAYLHVPTQKSANYWKIYTAMRPSLRSRYGPVTGPHKKSRKPRAKKSRKPRAKKSRKPRAKKSRKPRAKKPIKPIVKKSLKPIVKKSLKPIVKKSINKIGKPRKRVVIDLEKTQKNVQPYFQALSNPDLEAQRKQIYDEIAQRVHSDPEFENFRDLIPKNGNFDTLEYIGIAHTVMYYLQQTFQKSPAQIEYLASAVENELGEIIHAQEQALKEILDKKLKHAEVVRHDTPDAFTNMLIGKNKGDIEQWNNMGYTQIEGNKTTNKNFEKARRDKSIKKGHWSMKSSDAKKPENLLEMSNFTVKGSPDEVMMFHGSREQFLKSLRNTIDWRKGGGYLGKGFYLTFNPNEAKMYACSTALWGSSGKDDAVILETTVRNAKTLKRRSEKTWYSGTGDFRRNYRTDGGKLGMGWHDQINGRDNILHNLDIKRIHVVPIKHLIIHGDGSKAGNRGHFTVRDKVGWICGKNNKRPVGYKKLRKSRKPRVKKKTVAQIRAECKKQGLVYDTKTKKCRSRIKYIPKGVSNTSRSLRPPHYTTFFPKKKTVAELRALCKAAGLVYDTKTKRCRKSKKKSRKMKYKMDTKKKSS